MQSSTCKWALHKEVYHTECRFFLTGTVDDSVENYGNYAYDEVPDDFICPDCGKQIELFDRKFGR